MEVSRISSKGQVTIPKTIRELSNLNEGDRVAFLEDNGKVVITKASLIALREIQDAISKEAQEKVMPNGYSLIPPQCVFCSGGGLTNLIKESTINKSHLLA